MKLEIELTYNEGTSRFLRSKIKMVAVPENVETDGGPSEENPL